ncbi:MAG TPA: glycosyltransferase family 4 protein [Acidimicrobiales bacterium]|nr:glycosyltransferase family 4 protein [Acidimicrobiales bacterium]
MPSELGRGAQVYLGALCTLLDGAPDEHLVTTIFSSDSSDDDALVSHHRLAVPTGRLRRAGFDPRALVALTRHLRSLQPALIVAHGGEAMKYAVLTPTPAPLVYYRIGTSAAAARQGWRRILYRTLARRLAAVAAVSEATAAEARELLGLAGERVTVVANGRDPSAYATSPDTGTGPALRLVFVGHLTSGKRPERFVDLVAALRARGVAVEATMIGGGPLLEEIRAAAGAQGIDVLGQCDDVATLLGRFSVLVFTSAPAGEGMPGVLIEAGMAGLAVVATDVPGAGEVIDHGVTGLVVPVDDHQALVDAVERLAHDPDLRSAMGAAGRRRCTATFSLAASAARWSELIDEVAPQALSTPSPRRPRR